MSFVKIGKVHDLQHGHPYLEQCPCVFALQETDNCNATGIEVFGYVGCGWGDGRTVILCPGKVLVLSDHHTTRTNFSTD